MGFHEDIETWQRMTQKEHCPICQNPAPPEDWVQIREYYHSILGATPNACLRGTCCLIHKGHVTELFDMTGDQLSGFFIEASWAAYALKKATGAVKINYEIHGNTVPHLHMHLFPRYVDDPFAGGPIDFRQRYAYQPGEFEELIEAMLKVLPGGVEMLQKPT